MVFNGNKTTEGVSDGEKYLAAFESKNWQHGQWDKVILPTFFLQGLFFSFFFYKLIELLYFVS